MMISHVRDVDFRNRYYDNCKTLTENEQAELRLQYSEYLEDADGIIIEPVLPRRTNSDYSYNMDYQFYTDYLFPLLRDLLNQPQYQHKLLCASVRKGYVNPFTGFVIGEYGTQRLRRTMTELNRLSPDIIVFFEWNEANENTHYQPTVRNGRTIQRLVRYYARDMRGQPPAPLANDDLSIPNLVFSGRQTLRLGDMLRYELLNIPDSNSEAQYKVQLHLYDAAGSLIQMFPEKIFTVGELKAVVYEIPSEQLAEHTVIRPSLQVSKAQEPPQHYDLQYNRIHPTACIDYKETLQALRDLLPLDGSLEVVKLAGENQYSVTAQVNAPENLTHVELTDNEDEIYAADRTKRYDPDNNIVIQGAITSFSGYNRETKVTFEVTDGAGWRWYQDPYRYESDSRRKPYQDGNKIVAPKFQVSSYYWRHFHLTVPKQNAHGAALEIKADNLGEFAIDIADLVSLNKVSTTLANTHRLDLEVIRNLANTPPPLLQTQTNFTTIVESNFRQPVYQLRAIGVSGRIYRSTPVVAADISGSNVQHTVWSARKEGPVDVQVSADRIPALEYKFSSAHGATIMNSWEPAWDGQLGGGFMYCEPFNRPSDIFAHTASRALAPSWQNQGGNEVLEFDGEANYLNLPREALPYGTFTLEFEIKPTSADDQVLIRARNVYPGSLNLSRRSGKLYCYFSYDHVGNWWSPVMFKRFPTELPLPTDVWSKVRVSHDFRHLIFTVNGESQSFRFKHRGHYFSSMSFGGHLLPRSESGANTKFFKGQLRSLRIYHSVEK